MEDSSLVLVLLFRRRYSSKNAFTLTTNMVIQIIVVELCTVVVSAVQKVNKKFLPKQNGTEP